MNPKRKQATYQQVQNTGFDPTVDWTAKLTADERAMIDPRGRIRENYAAYLILQQRPSPAQEAANPIRQPRTPPKAHRDWRKEAKRQLAQRVTQREPKWHRWISLPYGHAWLREMEALHGGTSKGRHLTPTERVVGFFVSLSIQPGEHFSFIPESAICDITGFNERTVRRAIAVLKNKGWFDVANVGRRNLYHPNFAPAKSGEKANDD